MREVLSRYRLPGARFRYYPPQAIRYFRSSPASLECWRAVPPGPEGGGTMSTIACPHEVPPILVTNSPHSQGKNGGHSCESSQDSIRPSRTGDSLAPPLSWAALCIILARQPCKSSLYHSNVADDSRRDLGLVPFLTFSQASLCVVRDQSCLRAISQDAGAPNLSPVRAANLLHSPGRI